MKKDGRKNPAVFFHGNPDIHYVARLIYVLRDGGYARQKGFCYTHNLIGSGCLGLIPFLLYLLKVRFSSLLHGLARGLLVLFNGLDLGL